MKHFACRKLFANLVIITMMRIRKEEVTGQRLVDLRTPLYRLQLEFITNPDV